MGRIGVVVLIRLSPVGVGRTVFLVRFEEAKMPVSAIALLDKGPVREFGPKRSRIFGERVEGHTVN